MTIPNVFIALILSQSWTRVGNSDVNDIRSVDFYNFTYYSESWGKFIALKNGKHTEEDWAGASLFARSALIQLEYADLKGDGQKQAIIAISDALQRQHAVCNRLLRFRDSERETSSTLPSVA